MTRWRSVLVCFTLCSQLVAQQIPIDVTRPQIMAPVRSYMAQQVSPIRLANSTRLHDLIRAGKLYLSVEDALALAIENNLNLEIDRYGPALARSALERAKAGGAIRGVPSGNSQISSVDSGICVNGTLATAGLSNGGGGGGGGGGNGGATIQQIGAVAPQLDPYIQNADSYSHTTQPQANTVQSQTSALVDTIHAYNTQVTQRLISGGTLVYTNYEYYCRENAPTNILNPSVGPYMSLRLTHNLLQGFGVKLNDRGIRIAQINVKGSIENFRASLFNLVVNTLNQYWDLVAAYDELAARRRSLDIAAKFRDDTSRLIAAGALPRVEGPRAESEVASRTIDFVDAQQSVAVRSINLKQLLSRTSDPQLDAAEIIPLNHTEVPAAEELPPLRQLVQNALENRPDVAVSKIRDQTTEMNLSGTTNPLLPSLQVQGVLQNRGVGGTPVPGQSANPYFIGGYGTALGQIFRRNFPTEQAAVGFGIPFGNRQAQADYGVDQLQYRQGELTSQRDLNNIVVAISSQLNALQQARSRYTAAKDTRVLQEQLLAAEQEKFTSGLSTFNTLIADQRLLVTAQISEVNALASYAHARISLDQVLGETLSKNQISLDEALAGRISRPSVAPAQ